MWLDAQKNPSGNMNMTWRMGHLKKACVMSAVLSVHFPESRAVAPKGNKETRVE